MTAITVQPPTTGRNDRRRDRFDARAIQWYESSLKRCRDCGRGVIGGAVTVRSGPTGAGFGGLATCGSVWSCPVCSAKVAAHRQDEIEQALTRWVSDDLEGDDLLESVAGPRRVALVTFTMRHRMDQRLDSLWDALGHAWGRVTSGRAWKGEQAAHGVPMDRTVATGRRRGQLVTELRIGTVRVVEATHGANGWHLHVHALLLLRAGTTDRDVQLLAAQMFTRWRDALVAKGLQAPSWRRGVDAKLMKGDPAAALGEYFTKAVYSASMETARADLKDAKGGNRTPFRVLADIVRHGDESDLKLWHEWERASRGRRQIAWSVGLRDLLLEQPELTDEQIAELEHGGQDLAVIDRDDWRSIVVRGRWMVAILEAAELGRPNLDRLLDSLGVRWWHPEQRL